MTIDYDICATKMDTTNLPDNSKTPSIGEIVHSDPDVIIPERVTTAPDVEQDFDESREMFRKLMVENQKYIKKMGVVADSSEHPRAFEVLTGMIKQQADLAKEVLNSHKKQAEVNKANAKEEEAKPTQTLTNNNLSVGDTSELLKMIKGNGN